MLTPQFLLPLATKLVIDLFAGGGGASAGIEQAIGRPIDIAINHNPVAVSLHQANHPQTQHFISDVFEVDPVEVTGDMPVGLLWASPDCKHFSKAKGGKPVSKKIRGLAWVVIKWAKAKKPDVICLENVEEFKTWGPLGEDGRPCPLRKGKTFKSWVRQLENLGYVVEYKELRACDYGSPTIRKRLFLIARSDGQPIVWPKATHGDGLRPYRTAAECIDWSIPAPSIFEREQRGMKPLADNTMRRIAHGIKNHVIEEANPYIVRIGHTGHGDAGKVRSIREPLSTVTSKAEHLLVSPTLIQTGYGERPGQAPRVPGLHKPLGTVVDGQKHALVTAYLAKHFGGEPQVSKTSQDMRKPAPTVTARDHSAVVAGTLVKLRGTSNSASANEPLHTISAQGNHHGAVYAMLHTYYGTQQNGQLDEPMHTVTTKARFAIVTVHGADYYIADIGMRMLTPRELANAQGFPHSYVLDKGHDGKGLTVEAQVAAIGNSVCPPMAYAIVKANYREDVALPLAA